MKENRKKSLPKFGVFVCSRTSAYGQRPCDEAKLVPYVRVDRRAADDPMKLAGVGESWYRSGRNHRIEKGKIARDFDEKRWTVRIKDAASLAKFILKHGQVVLSIDVDGLAPYFEIEIYDDYRE